MTARAVRLVVIGVCVGGVAGMVVASVLNHTGAALTFGLITATAILCLMVATAVSRDQPANPYHARERVGTMGNPGGPAGVDVSTAREAEGEGLEHAVAALVSQGADEATVRDLVRRAMEFGRLHAGGSLR